MCNYTNENNNGRFDCQCPYRDTCERYGYRENYHHNDRNDCNQNDRRAYRGRDCNSCSICNIFRRCNH